MHVLILLIFSVSSWAARVAPCQRELDSYLFQRSIQHIDYDSPIEVISKERTNEAIAEILRIKSKIELARSLDERMRLTSEAHRLTEKYLSLATRDFTSIWGMDIDPKTTVNFDEHRIYTIDDQTTFHIFSDSGKLIGTSLEGREILVNFYDQNCNIESIKQSLDLGQHQGARYYTRLKLHRSLCQKITKIELPNEYTQLLDLMQKHQTSAVFLETQKEVIRKQILLNCNNGASLMGLTDFDFGD
jgi:hypothetical protein